MDFHFLVMEKSWKMNVEKEGHPTSTSHVIQFLTNSSSSLPSTCPNHLNLLFLIVKLTGSNP